jgi:P27 family predicted phage terminase small subunit
LIEGDRESRINRNEPVARSGALVCPEDTPADVREVWDYTVAELEHMGTDTPADRDSLLCYCWAVANHRKASVLVAKYGLLVPDKKYGGVHRNPAIIEQGKAAAAIRAFAQEFGLTPSARSQLRGREQDNDDGNPFADTAT